MNRQLVRLALVAVVLLVALVVATTYWQAWAAGGLAARQDNAVELVSQFQVARGLILASNGKTVFAANRKVQRNGQTFYFRRYPAHGLAAQTIGYSTSALSQTGLEESLNDYLTGATTNLSNAIQRTLDRLGGGTVYGDSVVLTLNAGAQALAQQLLGDRCGAVVAMNPRTGAVYVMASSPTYDPNLIDKPGGYAKVLKIQGACKGSSALLNRATDGLFTPGSTFKMVTAAAALDSGAFTPTSTFNDPGYCTEYGKQVKNALNPDQNGPEAYGHVDAGAWGSSTRSTRSSATSASRSARRRSSTTRRSSASTRRRRSRRRRTSACRAASTTTSRDGRSSGSRRTRRPRSTRAGSPSGRSGCR